MQDSPDAIPTTQAVSSETSSPTPTNTPAPPTGTPTVAVPTATPTPAPVCGAPPVMLILGVGIDYKPDSYLYGLADTIRIIRADFVHRKVSILGLPRPLEVHVPGMEKFGITSSLLNQAYFYGTEGMDYYDGPDHGAGLLKETLQANFGLQVDYYVVVNMQTFRRFVNQLGGIAVDVAPNPYSIFPAGVHTFNGEEAMLYAQVRGVDSIFDREQRQNALILAVRDRLRSGDWVDNLAALIDVFRERILTDLGPVQIAQITCLGLQLEEEDIQFAGFLRSMFQTAYTAQGYQVFRTDFDVLRQMIQEFIYGTWTAGDRTLPTPTSQPEKDTHGE